MKADPEIGDEIQVRRSDPVYNAHSYLTKVPVTAIVPFIRRYSEPGDVVLDFFAGSGMTGVAAAMSGRRAILVDISELGRHIGTNYLNFVDHSVLTDVAERALKRADEMIGHPYTLTCRRCEGTAVLSRSIWSFVYECDECSAPIVFFEALQSDGGQSDAPACARCAAPLRKRTARRIGEQRVRDVTACACSGTLIEQEPDALRDDFAIPETLTYPDVMIEPHREMFRRSALAKHGFTSTGSFFSRRNLAALAAIHRGILEVEDSGIKSKLLFVFTAILPRASKRYQWGPKRPLNAQNQTYYVAPVFLEWNVFDLFRRKLDAVKRSDSYIEEEIGALWLDQIDVRYELGSAEDLTFLASESVDYVFTDPPFGGNIFYSDMNLFQEAWLGAITDSSREAVIPTNGNRQAATDHYRDLLTAALREGFRVLKPGNHLSLMFSNSSGEVWSLAQQAIHDAGFEIEADGVCLLDKGQRSVKGLSSGYENVVTTDLVLTMRKPDRSGRRSVSPPDERLEESVRTVLGEGLPVATPSRLYLRVVRRYLHKGWDLSGLDYGHVMKAAADEGMAVDARSGRFLIDVEKDTG